MTGCRPKRGLSIPHVLFPANDVGLSPNEVTVAEVHKSVGYATAIIGKWHLGDRPEFLPDKQGVDLYFGLPYYGLADLKEFLAEMTESFFGVNDFFPFDRAELQEAQPEVFRIVAEIWTSQAQSAPAKPKR